jgi:hypothetical protein
MKVEAYLFIPYEGQVRFRYDTELPEPFLKSDGAYDKILGAEKFGAGTRQVTCTELVGLVTDKAEARKKLFLNAFDDWLRTQFLNRNPDDVIMMELGEAAVQWAKGKSEKNKLTVVLVSK